MNSLLGENVAERAESLAPLPAERLRWRCDPGDLGFDSTEDLTPPTQMVGQERGVASILFGLGLSTRGYNLFVVGPPGTGRMTAAESLVAVRAEERPTPADWCYLNNFVDPDQPVCVELPPGQGRVLAGDIESLLADVRRVIASTFESQQYTQARSALMQEAQQQQEKALEELHSAAERLGFVLQTSPQGLMTIPALTPGSPMSPESYALLPDEKKAEIASKGQQLQPRLEEGLRAVRRLERETQERLVDLDRRAAAAVVGRLIEPLQAKYREHPKIASHIESLRGYLNEHHDELRQLSTSAEGGSGGPRSPVEAAVRVNPLVSRAPDGGAPVVIEPNPTYYNLLGRVEYRTVPGGAQTDFSLIKPGALHRANGGYLLLQAEDLLSSPHAWEALKRSLRHEQIRIENLGEQMSPFPTATLRPEPIPLDVKVVLVGDPFTYTALLRLDEEFRTLFRVKAQFSPVVDRSPDSLAAYAAFVCGQARKGGLLPFTSGAVARVLEETARLADHQERLSTRFDLVAELVVEANHWAKESGEARIDSPHVARATRERERRSNLVEEELQRLIEDGTIAIDTKSRIVGQVNGLSVMDLGDYVFARPSRITARVGTGSDGIVNIEREVHLSGPTHSKGVLILSGYLLGTYGHDVPLALSARIAFEQVYNEVDGDSASSAELYALLSSLSDLPIRQGVAVTGSVNQWGEVQAVGGVTHKIEGFFAVCKAQGLTGDQGVLIPESNVRHLMLRQEVLDAVERGLFHVWAVRHVDEGLQILTGVPAGSRRADGSYGEGTVHGRVRQRTLSAAEQLAAYSARRLPDTRPRG